MSTSPPSRTISIPQKGPTLGDVLRLVEAEQAAPARRRQDQASAIRSLAKALGRRPEEVPAHPCYLRDRIAEPAPAMAGLAPRRWRNIVSLVRTALKEAGIAKLPARNTAPLAAAWVHLFRCLNDTSLRTRLSRFARWCSQNGIEPVAVDDSVIADFRQALEGALIGKARAIDRSTRTAWNRAAGRCAAWPKRQVSVPGYAAWY